MAFTNTVFELGCWIGLGTGFIISLLILFLVFLSFKSDKIYNWMNGGCWNESDYISSMMCFIVLIPVGSFVVFGIIFYIWPIVVVGIIILILFHYVSKILGPVIDSCDIVRRDEN